MPLALDLCEPQGASRGYRKRCDYGETPAASADYSRVIPGQAGNQENRKEIRMTTGSPPFPPARDRRECWKAEELGNRHWEFLSH